MLIRRWPLTFISNKLPGHVNAQHNFLCIRMNEKAKHFDAVLAQEIYEWFFMARRSIPGVLVAVALVLSGQLGELTLFLGPVLLVAALNLPRWIPALRREMELRGHMIEVLVAVAQYDAEYIGKLHEEAVALTLYKQFKGWTVGEIKQAMIDRMDIATDWVDRYQLTT
jgi:hypothetical protein